MKTEITLESPKYIIADFLMPEIAYRIPEFHAEVVHSKILGAKTTRYNGQKPKEVLRNLNSEEKTILSEARDSFNGNLLALQEKYLEKALEGPAETYPNHEELAQNTVNVSILEGIMQYEHRHNVKFLDKIARFQRMFKKDLLKQSK